jgi:hypothetical protein
MGVGQGGGETPSCLRISLLFFYDTEVVLTKPKKEENG